MGKDDKSAVLMFLNDPETKLTDEQSKSVYSIVTDKHTKRMTVDKSSGQPIAYFTSFKGGSTHETKIELAQVKDTSKFFPLTYSSVSHANDGSTTAKSEFKVTLADLNMPISPDVFTYKGMRLKNGTPVDLPGADRINNVPLLNEGVIDKRLTLSMASQFAASKQESIPPSPATPKPSLISQAWPYFLGFVVFAILGFWLLRKQRQAAKEG
jgi:hypothetical protein